MDSQLINDIFQWDVRNWSRALPLWESFLPEPGKALTVGERDGGLSLWLAKCGYSVIHSDLKEVSEKTKKMHASYEVMDQVDYQLADTTALPYDNETFKVVMFKSVLGALSEPERQQKAINEMHRVLQSGGVLLFAENLRGAGLHRFLRKRFIRWDSYWRYLHPKDDLRLFAEFSEKQFSYYGFMGLFGRSEFQRNFWGRIDSLMMPMVPHSSRYILFGACVK